MADRGAPGLVAVGWATVDADRALAGWGRSPGAELAADPHLGARVVVPGGPGFVRDARVVLLEPSTEGRLAASLARHGEGPVALYVRLGPDPTALGAAALTLSSVAAGPFGPQALVLGGARFGPHVVVVLDAIPADTIGP